MYMDKSAVMTGISLDNVDQLTIIASSTEQDGNVCGAAVAFGDDELLRIDDATILNNVASDCGVVLDRLSGYCLQASDLRINGSLVAAQASEDLLASNSIRLVDGVVRAVSRAIVAIKTKSSTTAEIALGNSACNEVLLDDSGRAEQGANRSCASTSTNLRVLARIHCGKDKRR